MAIRQIDCYGFDTTSEYFKIKRLDTHLVKMKEGVVYMCFDDGARRPVHRLDRDADGSLRLMWAYGAWADAETLSYVPINETLTITEND